MWQGRAGRAHQAQWIAVNPPEWPPRRSALAFLAALGVLLASTATALAATGQLTQLAGAAGCVSETGTGGACGDGRALVGTRGVAVSPDNENVYVTSVSGVAAFNRNPTTGALSQLPGTAGCVSDDGSAGQCADGRAVGGASAVTVSGDGKSVYVVGSSDAVAVFARNTTSGALTQLAGTAGCVSQTGSGGACVDGKALDFASSVGVSSDGKNVYVASRQSNAVAAFRRDVTTGALAQLSGTAGCVSETGNGGACTDGKALRIPNSVALSGDDGHVYVASADSDAVAIFRRNPTTGRLAQLVGPAGKAGCVSEDGSAGECADGKALDGARSVAVIGSNVYVASGEPSDAVALFDRDATSGVLTQPVGPGGKAGCVSETGSGGTCADGKALDNANWIAVSADGQSVYVSSTGSGAVAVFRRFTPEGSLTQLGGMGGCVSETGSGGSCTNGKALDFAFSVAVSPNGQSVYVGSEFSSAVAVFAREL